MAFYLFLCFCLLSVIPFVLIFLHFYLYCPTFCYKQYKSTYKQYAINNAIFISFIKEYSGLNTTSSVMSATCYYHKQ